MTLADIVALGVSFFSNFKSFLIISSITLIKKLITNKNEINKNDVKNIQECGNTDITGFASCSAQPSRVNTCIKVKTEEPKVENSINLLPNKLVAIIAKTYKNTEKTSVIATKLGNNVLKMFTIRFNFENLFMYFNNLNSLNVLNTIR